MAALLAGESDPRVCLVDQLYTFHSATFVSSSAQRAYNASTRAWASCSFW